MDHPKALDFPQVLHCGFDRIALDAWIKIDGILAVVIPVEERMCFVAQCFHERPYYFLLVKRQS
jgi:hypothetical protein